MANALLSAWAVKFLIAVANLSLAAGRTNAAFRGGITVTAQDKTGAQVQKFVPLLYPNAFAELVEARTVIQGLRAELVGILSLAGVNAGDAQKILSSLDKVINLIIVPGKSQKATPGIVKIITNWFNQYIKPLL